MLELPLVVGPQQHRADEANARNASGESRLTLIACGNRVWGMNDIEQKASGVATQLAAAEAASLPRIEIIEESRRVHGATFRVRVVGPRWLRVRGRRAGASSWELYEPGLSVASRGVGSATQSTRG